MGAAAFLDLKRALRALDRIAGLRRRARRAAGGVDFDAAEAKAVLDDEGEVRGISVRTRTRATSLVEEAMILANECVARRLLDAGMPALFRVHGAPEADSLGELVPVLQELGYGRSVDLVAFACGEPAAIQAVIERARGRAEDELVSGLVLRAMQRAVYSPRNTGHFGLASKAYCHFTSPIRRYPDLVAHRMLKMALHGRAESFSAQEAALPFLAEHASAAERVAEAAARETQELACVAYMARFAGREFDGVASGVSHQGLYVRLPNTVEGLVPSDKLGAEYFALDLARHTLCGQDSGRTFRLGQRLRVRIVGAPAHARKLDLALAE